MWAWYRRQFKLDLVWSMESGEHMLGKAKKLFATEVVISAGVDLGVISVGIATVVGFSRVALLAKYPSRCSKECAIEVMKSLSDPEADIENQVLKTEQDLGSKMSVGVVKSRAHNGLSRGLHEAAKVIKKHAAQICVKRNVEHYVQIKEIWFSGKQIQANVDDVFVNDVLYGTWKKRPIDSRKAGSGVCEARDAFGDELHS
ncbi:40S ribosomal protein s12 [Phtheirospermum japonicum]|uniref:40S ribosomal protein s12 n=1 Tax=Phtheirospermum japonicum TaxID=374723 RepID=A0A830BVE6_9LAMI|nr:40S ribosomal protein s12 [Phtheirospermum japonicum]